MLNTADIDAGVKPSNTAKTLTAVSPIKEGQAGFVSVLTRRDMLAVILVLSTQSM